ncbi:unnamed protein product [Brassica rapa]|uniref:Uncharacterized protein n=1 Tax=Brassica campestris TaxID=3711 RepID=A0A8D9GXU5_BRACM|nr:unnamed protein product [Brassica rapa]
MIHSDHSLHRASPGSRPATSSLVMCLTGAFPCTAVRPDDPIQDRGYDKSSPLMKDSSSNPVVLTSCLMTKVPSELRCTRNMEHARLVLSNQFVASPILFLLTDHVLVIIYTTSLPHLIDI